MREVVKEWFSFFLFVLCFEGSGSSRIWSGVIGGLRAFPMKVCEFPQRVIEWWFSIIIREECEKAVMKVVEELWRREIMEVVEEFWSMLSSG